MLTLLFGIRWTASWPWFDPLHRAVAEPRELARPFGEAGVLLVEQKRRPVRISDRAAAP
jgi:hypothetical protein